MDPFSLAVIVGLIVQFKGESTNYGLIDLKRWIEAKDFQNVSDIIDSNQQAQNSIKAMLSMNYDQLKEQLIEIEGQLTRLTAGSGAVGDLAASLRPDALLSKGASELIVSIVGAKANNLGYSFQQNIRGLFSSFIPNIAFDQEFILSDISELIDANFLQYRKYTSETNFNVVYTRSAATYVSNLQKNKS